MDTKYSVNPLIKIIVKQAWNKVSDITPNQGGCTADIPEVKKSDHNCIDQYERENQEGFPFHYIEPLDLIWFETTDIWKEE
jgi:hypothetical protein